MRYVMLVIVPLLFVMMAVDGFAQSSESTDLKSKVETLEKELSEIKGLLKQQVENDMRKDKELAVLKEDVKDKEKTETAKETPQKEIAALKEEVRKEIASIKEEVQKNEQRYASEEVSGEAPYLVKKSAEFADKKLSPAFGGVYTKPFLRRYGRNTYLGGYMDFQFRQDEKDSGNQGFDQTRFIPFIYSDVSDRVKLAAEIELEHGGVGGGRDGEVIIEFATVDFLITDWINWRGGFILTPLGKFNLVHDSPLQDLTDRPLVNQFIIPTTLTDAGMGFFGSTYPSELSKLDYEIYVTNGVFHGMDEGAYAFIETDELARSAGIADSMWGYYVEGRYHFMPTCLKTLAPKLFTDNSTFTGVLRWDQVQTSEIASGDRVNWLRNSITPGLNYRYTEDTVFKLDYQINMEDKDMADVANNAFLFSVATYF